MIFRPSIHPSIPSIPSHPIPSVNKAKSRFQKCHIPKGILKHQTPFSKRNKMERISNGPHWALLRRVPSGDKAKSRFQKGHVPRRILKHQTPFSKRNKMERISNGPHWALLCRVPSGDKTFSKFQNLSLNTIKWEEYQMDHLRALLCRVSPGD